MKSRWWKWRRASSPGCKFISGVRRSATCWRKGKSRVGRGIRRWFWRRSSWWRSIPSGGISVKCGFQGCCNRTQIANATLSKNPAALDKLRKEIQNPRACTKRMDDVLRKSQGYAAPSAYLDAPPTMQSEEPLLSGTGGRTRQKMRRGSVVLRFGIALRSCERADDHLVIDDLGTHPSSIGKESEENDGQEIPLLREKLSLDAPYYQNCSEGDDGGHQGFQYRYNEDYMI